MGRKPCCDKIGLKRGPWTIEEDHKLVNFIINNGIHCWRNVPKLAGLLRCGKSCRLRWINYLRPDLKRGGFTDEDEDLIIQLHSRLGNRWSKIASHFPGRTDNEIKNHWNTKIKKKMKLLGLDPVTHQPVDIDTEQTDANREKEPNQSSTQQQQPVSGEDNSQTTEDDVEKRKSNEDSNCDVIDVLEEINMESLFEISSSLVSNYNTSISIDESMNISTSESSYYLAEDSTPLEQWDVEVDDMVPWDLFGNLQDNNLFHF